MTTIINVVIGLILVYLLMGLFASAFQETIANLLSLRGTLLRNALKGLLDGSKTDLFQKVYGHALIAGPTAASRPSHVCARNFVMALLQALSPDATKPPALSDIETAIAALPACGAKQCLQTLLADAEGDLKTFKANLAAWFDDAMDHLSTLYKRYSHAIAFLFGLVLAISLNIDTLRLAEALWSEPPLREQIAKVAETYVQTHKSTDTAATGDATILFKLGLPIGWNNAKPAAANDQSARAKTVTLNDGAPTRSWTNLVSHIDMLLLALTGWMLTALAASMGAPFWFTLLQRILNVRNGGSPARKSGDPNAATNG